MLLLLLLLLQPAAAAAAWAGAQPRSLPKMCRINTKNMKAIAITMTAICMGTIPRAQDGRQDCWSPGDRGGGNCAGCGRISPGKA